MKSTWSVAAMAAVMFAAGFAVRGAMPKTVAHAQTGNRVFELRTYTAAPGKLEALKTRFRDHTLRFFSTHGMTNIGYWQPMDPPNNENTIVYLLAHESREAAKKSWEAFRKDAGWIKARDESQKEGSLTTKVESVFLTPLDFSPMK